MYILPHKFTNQLNVLLGLSVLIVCLFICLFHLFVVRVYCVFLCSVSVFWLFGSYICGATLGSPAHYEISLATYQALRNILCSGNLFYNFLETFL